MIQCSGQVGTLGQCTLPQEPEGPLGQGSSSWDPEAGPSMGLHASTNLSLELLATLGSKGRVCHSFGQMRKTGSGPEVTQEPHSS